MKSFLQKYQRLVFYILWFLLGLLQSTYTELIDDETYYWVYSKFLSWGYFDHPPMVALLIKLGYAISHDELGVRLIFVLLNTGTLFIIEKILERKNPSLFYCIALCLGMLQLGGILAVPDTALLFFTALFFLCYKKFTERVNWRNAILLGFVIALLFYSKYHGLLVVVFSLLSNLRLFKRKETWLAAFFAILFYAPHLLWQWENNWISFRYHLFESNVDAYKFTYTVEYIFGQLLLAGPLAGFILLPAAILYKPVTLIEKALKFTLIGVYSIFLLSSFRGRVEANWTIVVLIPLIVLSHRYINVSPRWVRPLSVIMLISLILVMAGRIYLVADIGPGNAVKDRFHHNKEWAIAIAARTGDHPVIFYNSYQRASRFWFYSGKPSHSLNEYRERLNNYNYWPTDTIHLGKPVYLADIYDMFHFSDSVQTKKGWVGWKFDSLFAPMGKTRILAERKKYNVTGDSVLKMYCHAMIPLQNTSFLEKHPEINTDLWVGIFRNKECIKQLKTGITTQQLIGNSPFIVHVNLTGVQKGNYYMRFGIQANDYFPIHCSDKIEIVIK